MTMTKKPGGDVAAQKAVEGRAVKRGVENAEAERPPPAGPHAEPALVNPDATPGAGTLPPAGENEDADSTSG
jgi:hypothetical protein